MSATWRFQFFRAAYQHPLIGAVLLAVFTGVAWVWRRLLFRTTFIGITGSVGKTSAKDALAAALGQIAPVLATEGSQNSALAVARQILRVRPWHRFAVIEVGAWRPGHFRLPARTLRPDLAIVLCITASHRKGLPTNEAIALEKVELPKAVPASGVALLNYDDPLVRGMARECRARVEFFTGSQDVTPEAARFWQQGEDGGWPRRFQFRGHDRAMGEGPRPAIETQFLGDHWGTSFGAAYAAARLLGLEPSLIETAFAGIGPFKARLEPVALANGVTFIRDEFKNDPAPFQAAVRFLRRARAQRRVAIIGPASDTGNGSRDSFREMARALHGAAELYVFVGVDSDCAFRTLRDQGVDPKVIRHYEDIRAAHDALPGLLLAGDLVLLKARTSIHLSRLFHAQTGPIACFKKSCSISTLCDFCPELRRS